MPLQFTVAGWVYRVRIPAEPIPNPDQPGKLLLALAVLENREILISPHAAPECRFEYFLHELRHAWTFHVPKARTAEEEADLSASIMGQLTRDLNAAGGPVAFLRLQPDRKEPPPAEQRLDTSDAQVPDPFREKIQTAPRLFIHSAETLAKARAPGTSCPTCTLTIAGGAIITGPATLRFGGRVVERRAYCPHCDHLFAWVEGCTPEGKPNGAVADGPEITRGEAVDDFLRQHPQAEGMAVG